MLTDPLNWAKMSFQIKLPGRAHNNLTQFRRATDARSQHALVNARGKNRRRPKKGRCWKSSRQPAGRAVIIVSNRGNSSSTLPNPLLLQVLPAHFYTLRATAVSVITSLIGGVSLNEPQQLHLGLPEHEIIFQSKEGSVQSVTGGPGSPTISPFVTRPRILRL